MNENERKIEIRKIIIRYIIVILLFLLGFISLPFAHDPQALLFDKIVHISSQILCICGSVDIGIKNYKFYKKYIK